MKRSVSIINEDGTLRAAFCEIQQVFSKEPNGPITHVAVHWFDDWPDESTGNIHIVPVEYILYERGEPVYSRDNGNREPEMVITRIAVSEHLRNRVYERDGHKCCKCGTEMDLSVDHVVPFSRGGETIFDNLQTLCMTCNRKKRASL